MSLEHLAKSAHERGGIYLLLTYLGLEKIALLQLPSEDLTKSKREGDLTRDTELRVLTSDMYSTISGGVKQGEEPRAAAVREARQEGGLNLELPEVVALNLDLPTTHTLQERNGQLVQIHGQGFGYEVTPVGLDVLTLHLTRNARKLEVVELAELLHGRTNLELRPFMSGLLHSLASKVE